MWPHVTHVLSTEFTYHPASVPNRWQEPTPLTYQRWSIEAICGALSLTSSVRHIDRWEKTSADSDTGVQNFRLYTNMPLDSIPALLRCFLSKLSFERPKNHLDLSVNIILHSCIFLLMKYFPVVKLCKELWLRGMVPGAVGLRPGQPGSLSSWLWGCLCLSGISACVTEAKPYQTSPPYKLIPQPQEGLHNCPSVVGVAEAPRTPPQAPGPQWVMSPPDTASANDGNVCAHHVWYDTPPFD